jgi:CRISPR/Cas system CMR-associated protein Cmr3 (group 5 of RAMP superfamily)
VGIGPKKKEEEVGIGLTKKKRRRRSRDRPKKLNIYSRNLYSFELGFQINNLVKLGF